jgi:polyisoprenoid-binding protein YceI
MATWVLDPQHSTISFQARHMMVSNVRGTFGDFQVDIQFDADHPEQSSVEARIAAASINTGVEPRDGHLRSPDFLDAAQYPTLTFRSTSIERKGSDYVIHGGLTIRDVTRPVTLDAEITGVVAGMPGMSRGRHAGFGASTKISRKDWGLTWNVGLEAGGWLVGDEVKITIDVEVLEEVEQPVEVAPIGASA